MIKLFRRRISRVVFSGAIGVFYGNNIKITNQHKYLIFGYIDLYWPFTPLHETSYNTMTNIWGEKNSFAIEIDGYIKIAKTAKIRFWINDSSFGDLRRKDKLSDAIKSFQRLVKTNDDLYYPGFDNMSEADIFSYCLMLDVDVGNITPAETRRYEMVKKFSSFFGEQLDNVANVIYMKNHIYHFLWSRNNGYSGRAINYLTNLQSQQVPKLVVQNVIESFLLNML